MSNVTATHACKTRSRRSSALYLPVWMLRQQGFGPPVTEYMRRGNTASQRASHLLALIGLL